MQTIVNSHEDSTIFLKLKFTRYEYTRRLSWKSEREFEYKLRMYDVAKIEKNQNEVIVYCIRDEKEEILISSFEKVFKSNSAPDKINLGSRTPFFTIKLIAIPVDLFLLGRNSSFNILFGDYINNYNSKYQESYTPPPRTV